MLLDRIAAADSETGILARDTLAAQQWEYAAAAQQLFGPGRAWPSPRLASFTHWLADCWEHGWTASEAGYERCLLSDNQSRRLWRRVIEESAEGEAVLGPAGLASLARDARATLLEHGLAPTAQRGAEWSGDSAAFLRFSAGFERILDAAGWVDRDSLLFRINRLPVTAGDRALLLLDPGAPPPEHQLLVERWHGAGRRVDILLPAGAAATPEGRLARDPGHELELAAEWARRALERDPDVRLALVIPDLKQRRNEVEAVFREQFGDQFSNTCAAGLGDIGICGAALAALALLRPEADFGAVSRWLRSPFFAADPEDLGQRATIERWLREDPRSAPGFIDQFLKFGLREEFRRRAPAAGRRLESALLALPRRATPTAWAAVLQRYLQTVGWLGFQANLADALRGAWDGAWSAFAELTPICGSLSLPAALTELEAVISRQTIYRPLAPRGVHALARLSDIGPGYAGAWIAGFTDLSWPQQPPRNPLLPWPVRRRHGLPGALPEAIRIGALAEFGHLQQRVPELVCSCPERIRDQPQVPNASVRRWTRAAAATSGGQPGRARQRFGARSRESVADPAPPLATKRIRGGARTLDLQSANPAIAFCSARLAAEPVEPPQRGIGPKQRGILVHRVFELLHDPKRSEPRPRDVEAAIGVATAELLPPGNAVWQAQVEAESQRLRALVVTFAELEAHRAPFSVIATEERIALTIGEYRLNCRIDRIDRLESGKTLLIDYKTGSQTIGAWFGARLGDCQMPLYAQHQVETVAAIAIASLRDDGTELRAFGALNRELPGRQRRIDDAAWQQQLGRWREQIELLVAEFGDGDVRVSLTPPARAELGFACLTRVQEQLL